MKLSYAIKLVLTIIFSSYIREKLKIEDFPLLFLYTIAIVVIIDSIHIILRFLNKLK
jgi:hypothetical protein